MNRMIESVRGVTQAWRNAKSSRRTNAIRPSIETLEARNLLTAGGTITGTVFNDSHTNGVKDAGELPLAGVTIFADGNGNGILDAGEVSARSGADGSFTLTVHSDGTFRPVQLEPMGFAQTTADTVPVGLSGGALVNNINFGDRRTLPPSQSFVDQAFRDMLGRGADAGAITFFGNALDQGSLERTQVSQTLASSDEFRSLEIDALFARLLHRSADAAAKKAFLGALANGASSAQLETTILASAEYFQNRGGGSNTGFATALFQDELARNIDSAGLKFAQSFLAAGGSRLVLAQIVQGSPESDAHAIRGLFQQFLHRDADADAVQGFAAALQSGASSEQVSAAITSSDEYFQRFCL
jgi:hypothetical protein